MAHEPLTSRQPRSTRTEPEPPPPDGLLWELVGDFRTLATLPPALALQVAHPAVGAGVDDHSVFRTDPWGRAARSLESMLLWVYGGERAREEGRRLRALHAGIRGTDAHGRPYRALDPATYAWVHATGFPVMCHGQAVVGRPLTPEQERRLYAEWLQVGRVLGIRDRDMPQTVEKFWPYYRRILDEEVELTAVVRELVSVTAPVPPPDRGPLVLRHVLRLLWPVLRPPFLRLRRFITIGMMPPEAREAVGLPWPARQEYRLRLLGRLLRVAAAVLPERLRYFPAARRARAEHRAGQPPADGTARAFHQSPSEGTTGLSRWGESLPLPVACFCPASGRFGLDRNLRVGSPLPSGGGAESRVTRPCQAVGRRRPPSSQLGATSKPGSSRRVTFSP